MKDIFSFFLQKKGVWKSVLQFFPKRGNGKYHPIKCFPILVPSPSSIHVGKRILLSDCFLCQGYLIYIKKGTNGQILYFCEKAGFFKRICFHFTHIFYKGCCLCSSIYGLLDTFYIMKRTIPRIPPSSFYPYTAILFLITPECFW